MIKIDIDSVIFKDNSGRCEGSVIVKGPYENIRAEIYTILKAFEEQSPGPYADALDKCMDDKGV